MSSTPKPIGPFPLGMDNRAPDFKLGLPEGAGHLLRDALNVDVTAQGSLKTRAGYALAEQGLDCHSGWSPLDGSYGLYCDSGDIFRIEYRDWDVQEQGRPWESDEYEFSSGTLSNNGARQVFEAIVFVLRTGCQWKAQPASCASWATR